MFNENNWNTDVARSYMNLYNEDGTVADAPTYDKKEETVTEPVQLVENPETEEPIEEVVESEETGDFLLGLLEDVQTAVGEELNEQEIEIILETVTLVVEGMVQKMCEGKKMSVEEKKAAKDARLAKKYRKSYEDALKVTNSRTDDNGKPLNPYDHNDS